MKLRKFMALALVSMCTVGLVFAAAGKGDQASGKKKIVIFQSKVEITSQLEAAAKAYTAETGVEVEVWGTTGDDYFQQFKMRIANNQGPTIFNLGSATEIAQVGNYCADLGSLPFLSTISNDMLGKFNNKVIGIPYTVEGFGMVYNKKLINPATVKDYASFVQMLQTLKTQGVNGFGLSQESYFLIGHILNHPFSLISDMPGYMDKLNKGQVKMADTPEFQEFACFYAAIRDNSYNPLEVNYDKECGDFATGKTASIHQGNWAYNMFSSYTMDFEVGLMPFPLMGNDRLAVSVPSYWCVNSQVPAAEQEEGKKFLTWLYSTPAGQRILTESFGFIPVVKGVTSSKLDPLSTEVARYAQEGKTRPWATSFYPAGSVDVHFVPVAQRFFTSQMTPEEFLAAMDKAWAAANGR